MKITQNCISITEAMKDLSREAFAIWIGLSNMSSQQLVIGKKKLSKIFGYSTEAGFHYTLNMLYNRGYIQYIKGKIGQPTEIRISKRPLISGANHFIVTNSSRLKLNIKNELLAMKYNNEEPDENQPCECDMDEDGYIIDGTDDAKLKRSELGQLGQSSKNKYDESKPKSKTRRKKQVIVVSPSPSLVPSPLEPPILYPNLNPITRYIKLVYSCPSGKEGAKAPNIKKRASRIVIVEEEKPRVQKTTLSDKMTQKRGKVKEKDIADRKKRQKKIAKTKQNPAPRDMDSMDFSKLDEQIKLDAKGKPAISFDANSPLRQGLLKILNYSSKHPKIKRQKKLHDKLKQEVSRIYRTYMKMLWRSNGKSALSAPESEEACNKYAAQIGVNCIKFGITPRQLWEYWDEHISNFADKKLKYPPLYLLATPMAAEAVVSALFEKTDGGKKKWKSGDFSQHNEVAHSFADTSRLRPDLRTGLIKAGFDDVRQLSDRYLMSVQSAAKALAAGKSLFVGGRLKDLAYWAKDNLEW